MSSYERAVRFARCSFHRLAAALALLLSAATNAAADAGKLDASLPILVYHQIRTSADGPADSMIAISLDRFEAQMRYLHKHGYTTLTTDQAVEFVQSGRAPSAKIVAIHFDDGWKSSLAALPILDRYGFAATFWIIAGTGIGWPHLDWNEVLSLAAHPHIEIQSHTWSHPWKDGQTLLDWIDGRTPNKGIDDARRELVESRRLLEEKLGQPVRYLAWPRGLYGQTLIQLAQQAGYRALFTADTGANHPGGDPLRMRRITVHGGCDLHVFEQMLADGVFRNCGPGESPPH
jgi:peptidoglycan/xylan/chitin deacetylase (PgdA/CDA1 family)